MDNIETWTLRFEKYLGGCEFDDSSHDIGHFRRVWKTANAIADNDVDRLVLLASSYFHDIVSYPKNHPKRSRSSVDSAIKAAEILAQMNFPQEKIDKVKHCIEAHSFSANIRPETIEAKILQDADRMEALGAIGLARTFYVAGRLNSKLFDEEDLFAQKRALDDSKYALDHFQVKLLKLPETMQTDKGQLEAGRRVEILKSFMHHLSLEL